MQQITPWENPISSYHIELTSKCALACPRCTRTIHQGQYEVTELSLPLFQQRFTPEVLQRTKRILFCGAHGDPIYHSEFHSIIQHLRQNPKLGFTLVTNGSHRKREWWRELAKQLIPKDRIKFSIDGLRDSNHLYRRNSRWDDVMAAVEEVSGKATLVWKFIVFRHNQHQIEEARALALSLGFQSFELVKSGKFDGEFLGPDGSGDPMKPDLQYVHQGQAPIAEKKIYPLCTRGELHYISASGQYFPCCWSANIPYSHQGNFLEYKRERDLNLYSLAEIQNGLGWDQLKSSWQDFSAAPHVCRNTCNRPFAAEEQDALFTVNRESLQNVAKQI